MSSNPLPPAREADIREREAAATKGPWFWAKCYELAYSTSPDPEEDDDFGEVETRTHWAIVNDDPHTSGKVASLPFISWDNFTPAEQWLSHPDVRFVQHARADIPALLDALDSERARAERAEKPWSVRLSLTVDPADPFEHHDCNLVDTGHSDRLLIVDCPEVQKVLDAAEARVRELEEAMRSVRVELAALVPDPEADTQTWTLAFPDIRDPDRKCLQDAYDIARTALEPRK